MKILSLFLVAAFMAAPDSDPQKGDNAAFIITEFTSTAEAMEYVVKEVLLPMDILPLRYDSELGFLVTERVLYKGFYNCDYVFVFLEKDGSIQINCRPRDYDASRVLDSFSDYSMSYNPKAVPDSPVGAYWEKFQYIVSSIPSTEVIYHGHDEKKQIREISLF